MKTRSWGHGKRRRTWSAFVFISVVLKNHQTCQNKWFPWYNRVMLLTSLVDAFLGVKTLVSMQPLKKHPTGCWKFLSYYALRAVGKEEKYIFSLPLRSRKFQLIPNSHMQSFFLLVMFCCILRDWEGSKLFKIQEKSEENKSRPPEVSSLYILNIFILEGGNGIDASQDEST